MKVCNTCGANNDDAALNCSVCGDAFETNDIETGDEATTLIEPMDANLNNNSQMNVNMQPQFSQQNMGMGGQPQFPQQDMGMGGQPQFSQQDMGMGGQPQFSQQNMGMGGQPQFSQQNMGMGGQPQFSQQDMGMGGQPQFSQGMGGYSSMQTPPPANKGKLFIILGAIVLVAVVAIALILLLGGGKGKGANSPEDVAKVYLQGMEDGDIDKIMSVAPPFATNEDKETIEEALGLISGFDMEIDYIGLSDKEQLDVADVEEQIKDDYGKSIDLDEAIEAELEYEVSMTLFGETTSEETSETMVFLKYKGKWYIGY